MNLYIFLLYGLVYRRVFTILFAKGFFFFLTAQLPVAGQPSTQRTNGKLRQMNAVGVCFKVDLI